jgi:hypothetical protein
MLVKLSATRRLSSLFSEDTELLCLRVSMLH